MNYNLDKFFIGLEDFGLKLSEEQIQQFLLYYEMLIEKNKVMNLTAITEFDEVIEKHFLDSLSIAKYVDINTQTNVLDMGTGAGFPGIPLAIAFPNLFITLMDSLNKRIQFLNEVIEKVGLVNVEAVHARAEEAARNKNYREQYDVCVSRAVANIATLSEYCIPFVKVGGQFVSYKSADIDEELEQGRNSIRLLGAHIDRIEKFTLPNSDFGRSLLFIQKDESTAKKYPRKAGTPAKEPLH